jgi:hypothetical protein
MSELWVQVAISSQEVTYTGDAPTSFPTIVQTVDGYSLGFTPWVDYFADPVTGASFQYVPTFNGQTVTNAVVPLSAKLSDGSPLDFTAQVGSNAVPNQGPNGSFPGAIWLLYASATGNYVIVPDGGTPPSNSGIPLTSAEWDYTDQSGTYTDHAYFSSYVWVPAKYISSSSPTVSISDAPPVIEGTTGPLFATFNVTLSSASQDTITVQYTTHDGTAVAGTDYTAETNQTLKFAPGQTSATISIPVTQEALTTEKSFTVQLSNPSDTNGGTPPTITSRTGTGVIEPGLFTTGADTVDFNNLTAVQQHAIAGGADTTHGLGGNDNVTLPNSGGATFYTGSTASDINYRVTGGSGNYNIVEGAGTEFITIDGNGSSTITPGSGTLNATIGGKGAVELTSTTAPTTGSITFAPNTTETLQIDGTTMPASTIYGFLPGDTIYLAGVPFSSASEYAVFQTSNNSLQPNNILHIVEKGQPYNLQFDPSQQFSGGFQLSADGNGTDIKILSNPVTGYSTARVPPKASTNPYGAVCEIAGGTGFIIGPHTILTAAHVVNGISGDFNIYIGNSNGLNGTQIVANSANVYIDPFYSSLLPIAQYDFAIINVSTDLSDYGRFQLLPNYGGGTVNITGYPQSGKLGQQFNDIGTVTTTTLPGAFAEGTAVSSQGESGGPLWVYNGSTAQAVGIVSGALTLGASQADVQLTAADVQQVQSWENVPILNAPASALSVTPGASIPMGITGSPVDADDTVSIRITGVPSYETITAGPGETVTPTKGAGNTTTYTITSTTPGTAITDLTLTSTYTGKKSVTSTFTVTASDTTSGETATSHSQTVTVSDPPISTTNENNQELATNNSPGLDHVVALFNQFIAGGFPDHNGTPITNALSQVATNEEQFLATAPSRLTVTHPHA